MYNREAIISKLEFMLEEIIHRSNGDHRKENNSPEARPSQSTRNKTNEGFLLDEGCQEESLLISG